MVAWRPWRTSGGAETSSVALSRFDMPDSAYRKSARRSGSGALERSGESDVGLARVLQVGCRQGPNCFSGQRLRQAEAAAGSDDLQTRLKYMYARCGPCPLRHRALPCRCCHCLHDCLRVVCTMVAYFKLGHIRK